MFPMKLITDYKILTNDNEDTLSSEVEKHLKKEWILLGTVNTAFDSHQKLMIYTQVVIKVKK